MVAIAQALAARGHRAVIAAPPDFGDWIRGFGFEFAGTGTDVNAFLQEHRDVLGANAMKFVRITRDLFERELPAQMDLLLELARDADAIAFGGGSVTVPSIHEMLGIPVLGVLFTTAVLPSREHAPVVVPWRTLPRWMNALLWRFSGGMWNRLMRDALNAARTRHGLAPVRDVVEHLFTDSRFVVAVDPQILPLERELAQSVPPVGFLFCKPSETALDPELSSWIDDGEPPVYIGFGSMMGRGPDRMRRIIVEALTSLRRRALVSRGWAGLGESLPAGWRSIGNTSHELLFPRMACVVHHGGSGTTAASLRAGVPQVLLPLILDQYHHAQRLYEEGLAPKPVPMERISARQLAEAIRTAMSIPAGRRAQVAQRLQRSDAAGDIVDRLEAAVAGRKS
jgi:Glycosyl transferases, related to UDP-glucuronosyltransferase